MACNTEVPAEPIKVTGITIDKSEASITKGETLTLTAKIIPDDAENTKVSWSTSSEVVDLEADGLTVKLTVVEKAKVGEDVTITVKTEDGGFEASCRIIVIVPVDTDPDLELPDTDPEPTPEPDTDPEPTPEPDTETPGTYTITYELDGGTNNADNPSTYTAESETITLKEPTKEGYEFLGWYEDNGFSISTTAVTEIAKGSTGNKKFSARWKQVVFTVIADNVATQIESLNDLPIESKEDLEGRTYVIKVTGELTGTSAIKTALAMLRSNVLVDLDLSGTTGLTSIEASAFFGCKSLESVTIPSSVKSIGAYAFSGTSIKSITIPDGVKSIEEGTFKNCTLTSVEIPSSVTSIGASAFDSSQIGSITIPESVTSIGASAFYNCYYLESITIPEGIASIEESTFKDCSHLTSVEIPNSVTSIGASAFFNCDLLESVTIPSSVKSIGASAFAGAGIKSIIIPDGVKSIEEGTFKTCVFLSSVNIPNTVESIGDYAFYYSGIYNPTIPEGVKSIGDSAFRECFGLERIEIPSTVESIGDYAFYDISGLDRLRVKSKTPPSLGDHAIEKNCTTLMILVPKESVETYQSASGWSSHKTIIKAIEDYGDYQ